MARDKKRCAWVGESSSDYVEYHDKEWGVPVYNDNVLFEFLILEGAQAGLSWSTILKKRAGYAIAFAHWDFEKVAKYQESKIQKLMQDPRIVRNQLKIRSTVTNAQHFIKIRESHGSFSDYLWDFVGGKPVRNKFKKMSDIPASTELSDAISKDLKKRGFKFVGSTIIYAYLQAVGVVNDHTMDCFRYKEIGD
ncbi:MAG: DNA-3-methyladenine glycosylase I [Cyclobacteriaceae bacterium]|nr:DNA-3-methyladenine glycosylase I [Cyclobacteriaceae bacterium]